MSDKQILTTDQAPAYVFSQGIRIGNMLQISGQGPTGPESNEYIGAGDVKAQTTRTLENVRAIVEAGNASLEDVLMLRVYLTKREDFAPMNEAYAEFVEKYVPAKQFPSRTTVFVGLPDEPMLVEIDAVAVVGTVSNPPQEPVERCRIGRRSHRATRSCWSARPRCGGLRRP